MDLHSGLSLWRGIEPPAADDPPAQGEYSCEVAIVGGGVTGALIGYCFAQEGIDVLLVDKGRPSEGSTSASTGLLQYEVDTPLADLIKLVGEQRAVHAYRRGVWAVDELERLAEQLPDTCGFSRRDSLYFASHWWHLAALRREYECRREHDFPVTFLDRRGLAEVTSIPASGAILSGGDAQINPYRFTKCLLQAARQKGMRIFGGSQVESIDELSSEVVIRTSQARIAAHSVVIATGYESAQFLPNLGNLQSTYALASAPIESFRGWPNGWLMWETARPYFYARQSDDGRVILGGADTAFSNDHERDGLVQKKLATLTRRFARLFPDIDLMPAFAWAGTFAETEDGLAYIGRPPGRSRTFAALGYGGNGITFSVIAARLIVDLFCGRPNDDADVFSFER